MGVSTPKFHTVAEAAHVLRMGRSTLYRAIRASRVPYTLDPAGRVRFTDDDLDQILANGHRPAAA